MLGKSGRVGVEKEKNVESSFQFFFDTDSFFCDLTFRICLVIEDSCFRAASIFSFVSPTPLSHSLYQLCCIVITK